jgi:hypothetical protein
MVKIFQPLKITNKFTDLVKNNLFFLSVSFSENNTEQIYEGINNPQIEQDNTSFYTEETIIEKKINFIPYNDKIKNSIPFIKESYKKLFIILIISFFARLIFNLSFKILSQTSARVKFLEIFGYINHLFFIAELLFVLFFANTNMTVLKFVGIGSYLMVLFFLSSFFEKQRYELGDFKTSEFALEELLEENKEKQTIKEEQLINKKRITSSKISDNYFIFLKISFIVFTLISIFLFASHMIKKTNLNNSFGGTIGYIVFLLVLFIFLILSFFVEIIEKNFKKGFDYLLTKLLNCLSWNHFEKFNWYSHTNENREKYNTMFLNNHMLEKKIDGDTLLSKVASSISHTNDADKDITKINLKSEVEEKEDFS